MKRNLGNYNLRKVKIIGGVFFALIILCLLFWQDEIPKFDNFLRRIVSIDQLSIENAFAGEEGLKEALVDSLLYNDTLIAVDTTAAPGDSFWVTIELTNETVPVAGVSMMLTYDTSIIYPTYVATDPCYPGPPCTTYYIEGYKTERTQYLPLYLWGGRAINNHLDSLKFNFVTDVFTSPKPCLPTGGSGPIVRFKFRVKPYAQPGDITGMRFVLWDYQANNYANTLADTIGMHNFIPIRRNGTFTVAGGAPPPIPTLSEWGLIIFGVVLIGFITWVFLKRKKLVDVRV